VILLKFIIAGVGPGDPDLVTVGALKALKSADLVLVPHSHAERASVAGQIVKTHLPDLKTVPLIFPMTGNAQQRDVRLREQLNAIRPQWQGAGSVVLPVIGDSTLYATGFYLYELWKEMEPSLELCLIAGISAHNFAASRAHSFLAMGEEIFSVIPGTADRDRIIEALKAANSAALYKPSALRGALRETVEAAGPWKKTLRIDRAGLPDERILQGFAALEPAEEYLSILLLWK
jgi:precorrin-2/cobalt-factor-2 C20-methyltransferase